MAVAVGHTASIRKHKNVKHDLVPFVLEMPTEDLVLYWTAKSSSRSVVAKLQVRAQQRAIHPILPK
jgi:hypothetical protein